MFFLKNSFDRATPVAEFNNLPNLSVNAIASLHCSPIVTFALNYIYLIQPIGDGDRDLICYYAALIHKSSWRINFFTLEHEMLQQSI